MYNVHMPVKFVTSELLDTDTFAKNYLESAILLEKPYCDDEFDESRKTEIINLMGCDLPDKEYDKLAFDCGIGQLMDIDSNYIYLRDSSMTGPTKMGYKPMEITPDALKLKTVSKLKERISLISKRNYTTNLKYKSDLCPDECFEKPDTPQDLHPGHELLIRIRIYHPFEYKNGIKSRRNPAFHQDLIVLGSQTLELLRDKIICPNDLGLKYDMSENPDNEFSIFSKDILKSGFLYIEDTFYNDRRDVNNIDYSHTITEWASKRPDIGPFKTDIMETTRFNALKFRLGYPQVYQHQGSCEHVFVFSDVEILQPSDCCYKSRYPLYKAVAQRKARSCIICGKFIAKWLVTQSNRVPHDPAFFCDICFRSYNYIDNKKIGSFEAYPYYDRMNVV